MTQQLQERQAARTAPPRCEVDTRRDEQCERTATTILLRPDGRREPHCTQHANEVDPTRKHRRWITVASEQAAHAAFIENMRSGMEDLGVQSLDAKIERLEHLTEGKYGDLLDGEQARYSDELEAAQAEWDRRFGPGTLDAELGEGRG